MKKWGLILLFSGICIFILFGIKDVLAFIFAPDISFFIKLATSSVVVGIALLALSAIKAQWGKKDKYDEVEE